MAETQVVCTLKYVFLAIGTIGLLLGLDFISGARFSIALKRILDKSFDIDSILLNIKARRTLGVILLALSLLIILLTSKTRL